MIFYRNEHKTNTFNLNFYLAFPRATSSDVTSILKTGFSRFETIPKFQMIFKSHSNLITHHPRHTYIITYLLNINCNTSTFCTLSNTLLSFLPKFLFREIKNSFLYSSYLNSLPQSNFHSRFIKFFVKMRRQDGAASRRP